MWEMVRTMRVVWKGGVSLSRSVVCLVYTISLPIGGGSLVDQNQGRSAQPSNAPELNRDSKLSYSSRLEEMVSSKEITI